MPNVLVPTQLEPWEYRLMLCLNGRQPFVDVVRDVREKFPNAFEAKEVWTLLYWLIENNLIESKGEEAPAVDHSHHPSNDMGQTWLTPPVQIIIFALIGLSVMVVSFLTTPVVISYFRKPVAPISPNPTASSETIPATVVRIPKTTQADQIDVAAQAIPDKPVMPPSPVEDLLDLRQRIVASQIRRDEYYLLNDEDGYRSEVETISRLAEEIGRIRAEIFPEETVKEETAVAPIAETVKELDALQIPETIDDFNTILPEPANPEVSIEHSDTHFNFAEPSGDAWSTRDF